MERGKNKRGYIPSRSLKLLPMLGVPSLSLEYPLPFPPGLRPARSIVLRGDFGTPGLFRSDEPWTKTAAELAEESDV